jgi:hypothetical protein
VARSLRGAGQLAEAASHFVRCAETGEGEAIESLRDALRQAEERGAYREALAILAAVVELLPPGDRRWLDIADAISWEAEWVIDHQADVHTLMGVAAVREIDALLQSSADTEQRARVKFRLAAFLGWGTGEFAEAERLLRRGGHALRGGRGPDEHAVGSDRTRLHPGLCRRLPRHRDRRPPGGRRRRGARRRTRADARPLRQCLRSLLPRPVR